MTNQFLLKIIKARMQRPEDLNLYYTDDVIVCLFNNEKGETEKIIADFFFFLKEYGYTLRGRRLPANVSVRAKEDYTEENFMTLPFFIDGKSKEFLSLNYVSDVLDIEQDGKSVFKLFADDYTCSVKGFNAISFMLFFDSYIAFFLNSFGKKFYYNKKSVKDLQNDLNLRNEKIKTLFGEMLK